MTKSIEELVRDHRKASRKVVRDNRSPAKARALLIRAGILEKHAKSPNGVRLVKPLR